MTPTGVGASDYEYTGQLSKMASVGLMYYRARWFDPEISHFTAADTLVPDANDPLSWDRYLYVRGNPIKFNDPTGHDVGCPASNPACTKLSGYGNEDRAKAYEAYIKEFRQKQWELYQKTGMDKWYTRDTVNNLYPGMPDPRSAVRNYDHTCRPHSTATITINSKFQEPDIPKDQITGFGVGVNISAGNPIMASNWSAGKEIIVYPDQEVVASYNYVGPGWSAGGGASVSIYGIVVVNANTKEDYTSFSNSLAFTASALDIGVTAGYAWSGVAPLAPGSVQAYYGGYAPGARLSVSRANALYWIDGSIP